jgi:high-affinity Fe2+/Pb2+ permease
MQNKKQSLIEAISGTVIGLVFSFIIQIIIYPALDIEVSIGQNLLITSIFFIASIVRGYLVRRLFNKIFKK